MRDDSTSAVLRRRFRALSEDGYNDEFLGVLKRAADEIERLREALQRIAGAGASDGGGAGGRGVEPRCNYQGVSDDF